MAKVVKYKVPSQAASGAQTFSDNLVGIQITDGSSQLTNTNFALDRATPEKDSKSFSSVPFSDFLTLDTLKEETNAPKTNTSKTTKDVIKFRPSRSDAGRSLFGSLKERINISLGRIIAKFPASLLADSSTVTKTTNYTAENISYDSVTKITQFESQQSIFYNPFEIILTKPNSNVIIETDNPVRDFYSAFKNYVLIYQGVSYNITNYTEPTFDNNFVLTLEVEGNLFSGYTDVNFDYVIKPNDSIIEEFFKNLDDLEELLLNRESNPIYTSSFRVPRDNYDNSATDLVGVNVSWPVSKDGWNPQIVGIEYNQFVQSLFDLSDEIDDYKSNLIVRFLTSPQLFEFDTEDKRAESVFQLYGQSFDSVKKYIDNIAFMRHVSYDAINNIPDMLLKNLSQNLGLDTVNLFDEKSLNDILYTRQDSNYSGVAVGKNLIESEYEFYRRILINLAQLYKSKGTRKTLEFFLKFLGAPEPMIKINEYVYEVTKLPNISTLEDDLYDVINDIKTDFVITGFSASTYTYLTGTTTSSSALTRDEYPIDENGLPRKAYTSNGNLYFQKGSGWYDITLQHRSPLILDEANSQLTGRLKFTKTKNAPYTYGEDYFDVFRNLPGLDYGFDLESKVDNLKIKNSSNDQESSLILNRKNISVYLSPSQTIDYDIWRQSKNGTVNFGGLTPQTGITFAEFIDNVLSNVIKNSHSVRYEKTYISLEDVYNAYVSTVEVPYDFITLNEFVNKMSPYWVQVVEQFIPATTLWTGGNVIENGKLGRSKFKYRKPCQLVEIIDDVYPEIGFRTYVNEIITDVSTGFQLQFGDSNKDGYIRIFPTFEIDGVKYSGNTSDTSTYVVLSGTTSSTTTSPKRASLYCGTAGNTLDVGAEGADAYDSTYCIDLDALHILWKDAIVGAINYINNNFGFNIDNVGKNTVYGNSIGNSALTGTTNGPLLSYEFFTDDNGNEKIKFKSYKYGPNSCTIVNSFNFFMGSPLYYPITYDAVTPLPTPSMTMTPTMTMTMTPTQTSTMTMTPTPSTTLAPTPSMTMTPTPSTTLGPTPSMTMTPTQTPTMTMTMTPSMTPTMTMTMTSTPSATPGPTPSYGISLSPDSRDDLGGAFTATVTAANISFPQTLYITILSTSGTVDLNDFQNNFPSTITLNQSGQEYSFSLAEDQLTEGTEKFKLELRSGSASGTVLSTSNEVTIIDGSLSPVYYQLSPCAGGSDVYSILKPPGTFTSGQRVVGSSETYYAAGNTFTVDPDPNGTKYDVDAVSPSINGCPEVTPPPENRTAYVTAWTRDTVDLTTIKSEVCGVDEQQLAINLGYTQLNSGNLYVDETSITSGTTYQLYTSNVATNGATPDGGGKWYAIKIQGASGNFTMVASINSSGIIQDWTPCSTPVPSLSMTPSLTPTPPPSTEPTYLTSRGPRWECDNGTVYQYDIYENTNSYFTGNQFSNGTGGTLTFSGITSMLTSEPITTPNWVDSGSPYCINGTEYQLKIDNNPCSSEYNTTDEVATGDNSECWQLSDVYYTTCANANSASEPYQSYVLNDTYKYTTFNVSGNWENLGTFMQGDWYFVDSYGAHRRTFYTGDNLELLGTITNTDLSECTTSGGGGDPLPPG